MPEKRQKINRAIARDLLSLYELSEKYCVFWFDCSFETYKNTFKKREQETGLITERFILQEYRNIENTVEGSLRGLEDGFYQNYNAIIRGSEIEKIFNENAKKKLRYLDEALTQLTTPKKIDFDRVTSQHFLIDVEGTNKYEGLFKFEYVGDIYTQYLNEIKKTNPTADQLRKEICALYHFFKEEMYTKNMAFKDYVSMLEQYGFIAENSIEELTFISKKNSLGKNRSKAIQLFKKVVCDIDFNIIDLQ